MNILSIAKNLWKSANSNSDLNLQNVKQNIQEMSITGNMPLKELRERKVQWRTVDDDDTSINMAELNYDVNDTVSLEPQRIRVFKVKYEA